jgi:hypothetical protein
MSRTIEILSIHLGPHNLTTRAGDQRTVEFEDKGGVGFALIDEDEAEILLTIGKPNYWQPGAEVASLEDIINADPEAKAAADKIKSPDAQKKVAEVVAEIKALQTVEEVDALMVIDTRPGVLTAAYKRKEELSTPA